MATIKAKARRSLVEIITQEMERGNLENAEIDLMRANFALAMADAKFKSRFPTASDTDSEQKKQEIQKFFLIIQNQLSNPEMLRDFYYNQAVAHYKSSRQVKIDFGNIVRSREISTYQDYPALIELYGKLVLFQSINDRIVDRIVKATEKASTRGVNKKTLNSVLKGFFQKETDYKAFEFERGKTVLVYQRHVQNAFNQNLKNQASSVFDVEGTVREIFEKQLSYFVDRRAEEIYSQI